MITSAEARLGRNMAILAASGSIIGIAINFLNSSEGWDPLWGLISGIIDFASNLGLVVMLIYAIKLFNLEDKPFIKALSYISIIAMTSVMVSDLAPSITSSGLGTERFGPEEISAIADSVQSGTWIVVPLWVLLVSMSYRGDILPSWGGWAGMLAGALMLLLHVIVLSGIGSIEILWPIWLVAGVIGFPLFAFAMSRAFANKI
ncbi:MAG: hypothetical protein MK000_03460 [Anaerolineales bacterium]|nr:hypothetical protein [Anaerolineales bacterium]